MLANVASTVIIALFAIAALNQLHIAQNVVNALLYATLIAVVGVVIVAVGGGGIFTMSQRWQAMADRYDQEKDNVRQQARSAPSIRQQAQDARVRVQARRRLPAQVSSAASLASPPARRTGLSTRAAATRARGVMAGA